MEKERGKSLTQSEASVRGFISKHTSTVNICRAGWPDFLIRSIPAVAVEVKGRTDNLSQTQRKMARVLLEAGIRYYVVRVLNDGSFEIVELGGHGRVMEEEFVRALEGISGPPPTRRGAASKARVEAVLVTFAKDQSVEPTLRKSKSELALESGVSLETFNRHRRVIEREALLVAHYGKNPVRNRQRTKKRDGD